MKSNLLGQLKTVEYNYLFGILANAHMNAIEPNNYFKKVKIQLSKKEILVDLHEITELLKIPANKKRLLNQFPIMILRTFLKDTFELIKNYCDQTKQYAKFKHQSWYEFARVLRNSLSHTLRFDFSRLKNDIFPISWNNISITKDLEGKTISLEIIDFNIAISLFKEMKRFVESELD